MNRNNPVSREKNVSGSGKGAYRRGDGLGLGGAVGNSGGYSGRPGTGGSGGFGGFSGGGSGGGMKRSGGGGCLSGIIGLIVLIFGAIFGGSSFIGSLLGGGDSSSSLTEYSTSSGSGGYYSGQQAGGGYAQGGSGYGSGSSYGGSSYGGSGYGSGSSYGGSSYGGSSYGGYSSSGLGSYSDISSLFGSSYGSSSGGSSVASNSGTLNTSVASGSRDKYTKLKGSGKDTVTIMIYMCGSDLESQNGMATSDLSEMANATISDNVNLIIYTGGCSRWRNNIISSKYNQIYQVKNGGLVKLEDNMGKACMTTPSTLTEFIKYCSSKFPADRNELIFWDHGGGSISGYGSDEKYSNQSAMSLAGIDEALEDAGCTFDFMGFDACLMGTMENGLMLADYADYLIASEETEPGTGWYYTNWLTALSSNTSTDTLQIGKKIIDDYVSSAKGSEATLSIVDLAELQSVTSKSFTAFAESIADLISNDSYKTVSSARRSCKEFSKSSALDQIDLADFAECLGNTEGEALSEAIKSAVKYNKTSSNIAKSYGIAIFFPYSRISYVSKMISIYNDIGLDKAYSKCIKAFAGVETSGQSVLGGSGSELSSMFGSLFGSGSSSSYYGSSSGSSYGGSSYDGSSYGSGGYSSGYGQGSYGSGSYGYGGYGSGSSGSYGSSGYGSYTIDSSTLENISELYNMLQGFRSSGSYGVSGMDRSTASFMDDDDISELAAGYIARNHIDQADIVWTSKNGGNVLKLSDDDWELIQECLLNVFVDDGSGFIDLGLDNSYRFDEDGDLVGSYDGSWLAIDAQPVAYYYLNTVGDASDYTITGYVPCFINDSRAELLLEFTDENPSGQITGYRFVYDTANAGVQSRQLTDLEDGDKIDFICDYYDYNGNFKDNYFLGEQLEYSKDMKISNVTLSEKTSAAYRLEDIYNQHYWTPCM